MTKRLRIAILFLFLAGCHRARIDAGPGAVSIGAFSANISAGDLLDPATGAARLDRYLTELEELGYRKQIRIILPCDWGPLIHDLWFPVIRRHGFKVLAILGQEKRDSAAMESQACAWVEKILPLVRDDLLGVQIVNEPAHTFTPAEYAAYHRKIVPLIRKHAPGLPIVAGDFDPRPGGINTLGVWQETLAHGGVDYDILSLHVTGKLRQGELRAFVRRLKPLLPTGQRIWITEGDWGQFGFLRAEGLPIDECFIYTWNDDVEDRLIRRPGGRLPQKKPPR